MKADAPGKDTAAALWRAWEEETLSAQDRAFAHHVVAEVIRRRMTLDYVIGRFTDSSRPLKPLVRNILRMGVCQILYLDRVPDAAAVSTSVELAVSCGLGQLKGFINGVLRSVTREKETIDFPSIPIRFSVPQWICDRLRADYGAEDAIRIMQAHLSPAFVTLRLDERMDEAKRLQTSSRILEETLRLHAKSSAEGHPFLPYVMRVSRTGDVTKLYGYLEGLWMVQDAAAALVAECADIRPGDTIVDVCASPGGKALHAAAKLGRGNASGRVHAFDLTEKKCARILENVWRMEFDNVSVAVQDARSVKEELCGQADKVICDLPCSGLGVLKHKSEIKYRLTPEDITALCALQREILGSAVRYLKPGGTLIYSTCTLTREENEETADWIASELHLIPEDIRPFLPEILKGEVKEGEENRITILPFKYDTDGAFIARFRKP